MDQTTIRLFLVGSLFAMAMFVFATVYANRGVSASELREVQERQRQGTECVLLLLTEHRLNSHYADETFADQMGIPLEDRAPEPVPATVDPTVCDGYLDRTAS